MLEFNRRQQDFDFQILRQQLVGGRFNVRKVFTSLLDGLALGRHPHQPRHEQPQRESRCTFRDREGVARVGGCGFVIGPPGLFGQNQAEEHQRGAT